MCPQTFNNDVQDHAEPVQRVIQDANTLFKVKSSKLSSEDQRVLRENSVELQSRYDHLNKHSTDRLNKLSFALSDLEKMEEDFAEFSDWLQSAEQELGALKRNIAVEAAQLEQQVKAHKTFSDDVMTHSADLKYMNKASQQFLNLGKVILLFCPQYLPRKETYD